jgi:hypothetical protein
METDGRKKGELFHGRFVDVCRGIKLMTVGLFERCIGRDDLIGKKGVTGEHEDKFVLGVNDFAAVSLRGGTMAQCAGEFVAK